MIGELRGAVCWVLGSEPRGRPGPRQCRLGRTGRCPRFMLTESLHPQGCGGPKEEPQH